MTTTQTATQSETEPSATPGLVPTLELMEAQLKTLHVGVELLRARAENLDLALAVARHSRRRWWQ